MFQPYLHQLFHRRHACLWTLKMIQHGKITLQIVCLLRDVPCLFQEMGHTTSTAFHSNVSAYHRMAIGRYKIAHFIFEFLFGFVREYLAGVAMGAKCPDRVAEFFVQFEIERSTLIRLFEDISKSLNFGKLIFEVVALRDSRIRVLAERDFSVHRSCISECEEREFWRQPNSE